MSFATSATRSVSDYRALVQLDISKLNLQWVNAGAGIWYVNFDALYPEVDSTLLDGFTEQAFGQVGSVQVDGVEYTLAASLAAMSATASTYWYSGVSGEVYIHFETHDDPILHTTYLGVVFGYSYSEFTPVGSSIAYEGRLLSDIRVSESRDPLYFGKLRYNTGSIELNNGDGYFDSFPDDYDFYGNQVRILVGFEDLDIASYTTVITAAVERVTVSEGSMSVGLADRRKTLTRAIEYTCTAQNALASIREILLDNYGVTYDATYYDTTAWAAAEAAVDNVTIDIRDGEAIEDQPAIEIIEGICASVFGLFRITPDNKYSFKIVNTSATSETTIVAEDVLNQHAISYDPTEVISSAKVGYAKDWNPGYTSPYTFYTDTTYEAATYLKYKVYSQREFFTDLVTVTAATSFASTVMLYAKDVHGTGEVTVPLKYYDLEVGDMVDIEFKRGTTADLLGTKKCEITSKSTALRDGTITIGYRIA